MLEVYCMAQLKPMQTVVGTRVVKKLENLKPDPTDHFGPHRGPEPKKPDPRKVNPDSTPNLRVRSRVGYLPKTPAEVVGTAQWLEIY